MNNPFDTSGGPPVFGQPSSYTAPNTADWQRSSNEEVGLGDEEDEPFTAAHLAAANQVAVPSVTAAAAPPPLPVASSSRQPHTTLNFTGTLQHSCIRHAAEGASGLRLGSYC